MPPHPSELEGALRTLGDRHAGQDNELFGSHTVGLFIRWPGTSRTNQRRAGMGKPQQPELGRSGHTPVVEGQHAKEVIQGEEQPGDGGPTGPVPEDNRPGHHPEEEQDKPDLEAFRGRLSGDRRDA
jgi:hypothetical protein